MIRVLHVVPAIFGSAGIVGGAERYVFELARYMADIVPTRLVSFGQHERAERIGHLDVRVIGNPLYVRGQRTNPVHWKLLSEVAAADVIHCHQQHVFASSVSAAAARVSGGKVFVSDLGGGGWDISGYISTDRWYHGHLHISEYSRTVSGHAANPRASVILGGVDTTKFSPAESVTRDGSVVYVGRIMPHKGIDDLVEAVGDRFHLKIIGRPYDERFMSDLRRLAVGKHVTFVHDADDTAIVDAYRRAICVVLPSVYRTRYGVVSKVPELLGQTLLEGMACGTPAICTNVASMPEVVEDGVSGRVVPPNDPAALHEAIGWFHDHPAEVARMGGAARQRVLEKFTWPTVVQRCLEIYTGNGYRQK